MDIAWLDDSDEEDRRCRVMLGIRACSVASTSTILPDTIIEDENDYDVIEIEDEENAEPEVLFGREVIDLTTEESERRTQQWRTGETRLDSVTTPCGTVIKPGKFFEVRHTFLGGLKINFVQVASIVRNGTGQTFIRGTPFTRLLNLNGRIPNRLNEVCMIQHVNRCNNGEEGQPVLLDVELRAVKRWRTLVMTNAAYPAHAIDISTYARNAPSRAEQRKLARKSGVIACRWKMTLIYSTFGKSKNKPEQEMIEHLRSGEIPDARYRVSDESVSREWRRERKRGGGWQMQSNPCKSLKTSIMRQPNQRYTVFDSFSGAGGVSRGAQDAGFKIRYAIDKEAEV